MARRSHAALSARARSFDRIIRNGLSAHPEEIPLSGFIAFMRFYTLLRRDTWAFSYLPADGGTSLVEPIAQRSEELGDRHLTQPLSEQDQSLWFAHTPISSFTARSIILATDSPNTRSLLCASEVTAPIANDLVFRACRRRFYASRLINQQQDRSGHLPAVVIDNYFWLHRIQDQYIRWSKTGAPSRCTSTARRNCCRIRCALTHSRRRRCAGRLPGTARPSDPSSDPA
jgi:isorenieratene synthase